MWNALLDASIFWSFDRSGFLRHQKSFTETYHFPPGSRALITGGTSGIGKATAIELARRRVLVTVTGRDVEKGEAFAATSSELTFRELDLSKWPRFDSIVSMTEPLDHLVLNAGGMPERFQTNDQGIELQFASQLFGHYILARKLLRAGKLNRGARIIWVTSGGMYLKALDLSAVTKDTGYDKVTQYANVKRAQVTLLPFFKKNSPSKRCSPCTRAGRKHPGSRARFRSSRGSCADASAPHSKELTPSSGPWARAPRLNPGRSTLTGRK